MRFVLITLLGVFCFVLTPQFAFAGEPDQTNELNSPLKKKKKKKKKKKGVFKKIGKTVKKAAKKTGKTVKKAAKKTGKAVKKAAKKTGKAVKKAAKKTGKAVKKVAKKTGRAVEKVAKKTGKKVKESASCTSAGDLVGKVWKKAGPEATAIISTAGPVGAAAAQVIRYTDKGIKFWNAIVGKGSKAKMGPRRMKFNQWQDGKVLVDRVMVAPFPAIAPVTIKFHKLGGQGELSVAVCTRTRDGKAKKQASFTVKKGTKNGRVKKIQLKNAAGKVITVVMHQRKALKAVKWKMNVSMTGR